jgi:hypothetical protein
VYADENTETSNNYLFTGAFEEDKTRREFISLISNKFKI